MAPGMRNDGLNHYPSQCTQNDADEDDDGIFPNRDRLRRSNGLIINTAGINEVPESVFDDALAESVGRIDFCKNRLEKLPNGLSKLHECATELDLSHNFINAVPTFLGSFNRLGLLNISCNSLDDLPNEMGQMSSLRELIISNNKFTKLPECVYNIASLELLNASNNQIESINVDGLEKLERLVALNVSNNNISTVPPKLGLLKNIVNLEIRGNPFRLPRCQTLDKGTEAIMNYLRDRIPTQRKQIVNHRCNES